MIDNYIENSNFKIYYAKKGRSHYKKNEKKNKKHKSEINKYVREEEEEGGDYLKKIKLIKNKKSSTFNTLEKLKCQK